MKRQPIYSAQELKEKLSAHGLKVTSQRLVIYRVLKEEAAHPTAEQVFDKIKEENPSISLGTVYKTLDTLVEAGLARKVKTEKDVQRFDARTDSHSHLYCSRTHKIVDYEDEELQRLIEGYFEKKQIPNFKIGDIQLHINGEYHDSN